MYIAKQTLKCFVFFFFGSILKEMSFCPYLSYKDLVIISLKRSSFSSPYISKENFKCCWPWTNCFTFLCLSLSVLSSIIIPNTAAVPFMVVRWKLVSHVQNQSHLQNSPWHTPTLSFICQALQFPVGFGMCLFLHRPLAFTPFRLRTPCPGPRLFFSTWPPCPSMEPPHSWCCSESPTGHWKQQGMFTECLLCVRPWAKHLTCTVM